ncbi:MAG: tail protein X [Candidatus Accumulibacter sp.]|nr:tail protein X [Accumulibacter sp.]
MKAILHRTGEFERWDTLAWKYYGDPLAYGRIIEANPALDIGAVLPAGVIVLIPVLPLAEAGATLSTEDLPPWKR